MTDFYNYHTKIEEECLTAFKQHCLEALGNMNNQKKNDNGVPTEPEIIYFALLDEWALWLDSQAKSIKQCAQDRSPQQRAEIIASVKNFLHTHPISPVSKALEWINCPQPLIALGLIRINNGNIPAAEKIFDNVISKFPEFAGDACYYKGLIHNGMLKRVKKNIPKIGNENSGFFKKTADEIGKTVDDLSQSYLPEIKDAIPQSLCEMDDKARIKTEDEFLQALQTFNLRADRKKELHTIITRLQQTVGPQIIKSSGFQNQADDISNIYDCLATSAYDMIGHPISFQTFSPNSQTIEDKYKAYQQFLNYLREGYISPKMLNHKILESQCEVLKNKHMLSKIKLQRIFKEMIEKSDKMEFYGRTVFQEAEIRKAFKLPKREEFWGFLESFGCFKEKREFYVLQTAPTDGKIHELQKLQRSTIPPSEIYRIQLSDYDLNSKTIYNAVEVEKAFETNKEKLEWLEDQEFLVRDASGIIDFEKYSKILFMPNYDYFVIEDLAEWLEITNFEALWIAQRLVNQGTLKIKEEILTKINSEAATLKFDDETILQKYKAIIDSSGVNLFSIH
uniref:Uncharacterized protein n=1 Tax=Panagrolaimus superbus TaxID=310955 RepID=A0A914YGM8_9BILA